MGVTDFRSFNHLTLPRITNTEPPSIPDRPIYTTSSNIAVVLPHGTIPANPSNLSAREALTWPINDHMKAHLLALFFKDTSRWCEITNSLKPFSTTWGHLVAESQAFAAAAVTLASIKSLKGDITSALVTSELYNFARNALRYLKGEHDEGTLLATTLLCMYCSATENAVEGKVMLQDCASLLQATESHSFSRSIASACFWTFARQGDLTFKVMSLNN